MTKKKWLNIKNENRFASKRTSLKESREPRSSDRFRNVIYERNRRKLKKKYLKLSTNDTRPFPSEASMCKLVPSGDN